MAAKGKMDYLHTCDNLLKGMSDFMMPLQRILKEIKKQVEKGHRLDDKDTYFKRFYETFTANSKTIGDRWMAAKQNCYILDPLCTNMQHYNAHAHGCVFKQKIKTNVVKAGKMNNLVFPKHLPPTTNKQMEEVWGDDYFIRYWILISHKILCLIPTRLESLSIKSPDEMIPFCSQWMQEAFQFQLIWEISYESHCFQHEIPINCFYILDEGGHEIPRDEEETNEQLKVCTPEDVEMTEVATNPKQEAMGDIGEKVEVKRRERESAKGNQSDRCDRVKLDCDSILKQVQFYSARATELENKVRELEPFKEVFEAKVKAVEQHRRENEESKKTIQRLRAERDQKDKEIKSLHHQYSKQLNHEISKITAQHDHILQQKEEQIAKIMKENRELRESKDSLLNSMSAMMNQQMSRDESDLENINVKNRPMKIMEEFHMFCSQEWLEAKSALDDWAEDNGKEDAEAEMCCFVTDAMLGCLYMMKELHSSTHGVFLDLLNSPLQPYTLSKARAVIGVVGSGPPECMPVEDGGHRIAKRTYPELDEDLKVQIAKYLKKSCDDIDFKDIAKELLQHQLQTKLNIPPDNPLATNKSLLDFFEKCLLICWKMVLQLPPMKFVCDPPVGGKFDENKHELHFGSADPNKPGAVIHYYVHPALAHGDKQMKKARVVLHIPRPANKEDVAIDIATDEHPDTTQNRPETGFEEGQDALSLEGNGSWQNVSHGDCEPSASHNRGDDRSASPSQVGMEFQQQGPAGNEGCNDQWMDSDSQWDNNSRRQGQQMNRQNQPPSGDENVRGQSASRQDGVNPHHGRDFGGTDHYKQGQSQGHATGGCERGHAQGQSQGDRAQRRSQRRSRPNDQQPHPGYAQQQLPRPPINDQQQWRDN